MFAARRINLAGSFSYPRTGASAATDSDVIHPGRDDGAYLPGWNGIDLFLQSGGIVAFAPQPLSIIGRLAPFRYDGPPLTVTGHCNWPLALATGTIYLRFLPTTHNITLPNSSIANVPGSGTGTRLYSISSSGCQLLVPC